MIIRIVRAVFVVLTLLAVAGCGDGSSGALPQELGDCPDGSTVTWTDAQGPFAVNCTRCHSSELVGSDRRGAPTSSDFDTAEAAALNGASTWQRIQAGQMPNDDEISSNDDALIIREWLACDAPE